MLTNLFGPSFAPALNYSGIALTFKLVPNSIIGLATGLNLTPNQRNRAAAFDQAVIAGYNPQGFFALFNQSATLPAALDQLTGEIHSATRVPAFAGMTVQAKTIPLQEPGRISRRLTHSAAARSPAG